MAEFADLLAVLKGIVSFYNANPGLSYAFVSVIVAVVLFATESHVSME